MNLSTFGNLRCNFIIFLSECSHLLCTQGLTQHCCHLVCIWCTWHYVIATFNYCHLIYIWHVECNFYVHKVHLLQFLACDITILISVKEFESFSDCFSIVVLKLTHLKWSIRLPKFTVYYQNVAFFKCFPLHSPLLPSSSLVPGTQETQLFRCRQRPPVIDDDVQALYYKYKVQFEIEKEKVLISSNSYDNG